MVSSVLKIFHEILLLYIEIPCATNSIYSLDVLLQVFSSVIQSLATLIASQSQV